MPGKENIFIADDDEYFCELYRIVLGAEGYQVKFAYNGKEALEKLPNETPDLVILDVVMPGMEGYEVCRRLREIPKFALTPVIMLTSRSTDEDRIKGYNVGADDYIIKPFSWKVLKERVRSMLDRTASRRVEAVQPPPEPQLQPESQPQPEPQTESRQPEPQAQPQTTFQVQQPQQPQFQVQSQPQIQPIIVREEVTIAAPKPITAARTLKPGESPLEQLFGGVVPAGANILIMGTVGCGKSFFSRLFLVHGLRNGDKCMSICLDDDPSMVRKELSTRFQLDVAALEKQDQMRFVDAYSWSGGRIAQEEKFAITGTLELSDLSALITEAGAELGQTDKLKKGGRRVVDSISSLFLNFELSYVQRFISFLARSGHFAGVSTIFVVEQGACDEQALNNIKYLVDGVLEFRNEDQKFLGRAQTMKWAHMKPEWTDITQAMSQA